MQSLVGMEDGEGHEYDQNVIYEFLKELTKNRAENVQLFSIIWKWLSLFFSVMLEIEPTALFIETSKLDLQP